MIHDQQGLSRSIIPVIFVGHGSPLNAIEKNEFSDTWRSFALSIRQPSAILCISAHWETNGTMITGMEQPRTIHDFGGFPQELYQVHYPAPGNPTLANEIISKVKTIKIKNDLSWGLDHGCWSVLSCMYPNAGIPVIQLSLNYNETAAFHYELAKELFFLREKNVLIIGSGNIVHNLRLIDWDMQQGGLGWAVGAEKKIKELIDKNDHACLIDYKNLGKEIQLAIPTPEHYLPLLYILALKQDNEKFSFFNDKLVMGSLSMTSLIIG